jgi:hypothetical protein
MSLEELISIVVKRGLYETQFIDHLMKHEMSGDLAQKVPRQNSAAITARVIIAQTKTVRLKISHVETAQVNNSASK